MNFSHDLSRLGSEASESSPAEGRRQTTVSVMIAVYTRRWRGGLCKEALGECVKGQRKQESYTLLKGAHSAIEETAFYMFHVCRNNTVPQACVANSKDRNRK